MKKFDQEPYANNTRKMRGGEPATHMSRSTFPMLLHNTVSAVTEYQDIFQKWSPDLLRTVLAAGANRSNVVYEHQLYPTPFSNGRSHGGAGNGCTLEGYCRGWIAFQARYCEGVNRTLPERIRKPWIFINFHISNVMERWDASNSTRCFVTICFLS